MHHIVRSNASSKIQCFLKDSGKLFVMQQLLMVMLLAQLSLFILTCKLSFETNVSLNHFRRWQFKLLFAFTIQA